MTDLIVDRLTATSSAPDERRVRRMLTGLAGSRLDQALAAAGLPSGDWCLRRIDVTMRLDDDRSEAWLETRWAQSLATAVRERIVAGDGEAVHYARPVDGVADLLIGLATGDISRDWAWRQLGLLGAGDPEVASSPAAAALAALRRRPELALAALSEALQHAGAGVLHRMLGPGGWSELARDVLAARGCPVPPRRDPERRPAAGLTPAAGRLATQLRARSGLAATFGRARVRVDPVTAWAWALLVAAETEPALLRRRDAPVVLAGLMAVTGGSSITASRSGPAPGETSPAARAVEAAELDEGSGGPAGALPRSGTAADSSARADGAGPGRPRGEQPGDGSGAAADARTAAPREASSGTRRADPGSAEDAVTGTVLGQQAEDSGTPAERVPAGPEHQAGPNDHALPAPESEPEPRWPTSWAGLLFLLATAAAAGIPDELLADPALADRPLAWTLHHLGGLLVPADPADPALFALTGAVPSNRPPGPGPGPELTAVLARHARRWAEVTARRLGMPDGGGDPFAVVARIAGRPGAVSVWPGWVEVQLALDGVDLDVRRAGLDADPGWVPWLGTVVMFRYE